MSPNLKFPKIQEVLKPWLNQDLYTALDQNMQG